MRGPMEPSGRTLIQRAIAILRRFGTNAHIYLPGVGMLNGLTAANYLDSAGTTAGTVDQPVGLVLDAAGSLGVELVTTGQITLAAAGSRAVTGATIVAGKTYAVNLPSGVLMALTSGYSVTGGGGVQYAVANASGSATCYSNSGTTFTPSVREVTGIHSSQPTTSAKPILRRGAVNLLTYSGDFGNAAWTKASITVNGPELTTAVSGGNSIRQTYSVTPGSVYTLAIQVRRGTMSDASVSVWNVTAGSNVLHGSYIGETNTLTDVIVTRSFTAPAGCTSVYVYPLRDSASTGTMFVASAALFQGTYTAAQIQALGGIPLTTTAPASTALGPYFFQFDGSNDSLSLGGPLFQMADDHCVVAGARADSLATTRIIFSQRNTGTTFPAVGQLQIGSDGSISAYYRNGENTATLSLTSVPSSISLGESCVLSELKVGTTSMLRKNSVQKASGTAPTLGTYTINAAAIGASAENGSLPQLGAIYPVIAIKGAVTDPDLLLLERLVANLSGVQI